jgi:hypothetical protein
MASHPDDLQRSLEQTLLSPDGSPVDSPAAEADAFAVLAQSLAADLPVAWTARPQAQGDLLVLPWPADAASARRAASVAAAQPVPHQGIGLVGGRHQLQADGPDVLWSAEPPASIQVRGQTLGTLVVLPGSIAVLGHQDHGDLHIGAGVYVIRGQRVHIAPAPPAQTAPRPDPEDWRTWAD